MGNLVFQAASGGQVALSGPNTASSYTIAVPAITGTLVTTGDTGTVTTTMLASTTGSGAVVLSTSPTLVTPALGTPSSVTLTNATGLPISTGLSGLTTNGVAYATSSTALATGSSFVWTGSALGVGTGSPSAKLTVTASSGSIGLFTQTSATGYGLTIVPGADSTYDAFTINNAANTINAIRMFGNGNATFSGNVGIGTSSPGSPLTVSTTGVNSTVQINSTDGAGGYGAVLSLKNTGTGGRDYYISSTSNADGGVGGGKLKFYDNTAGTTRMLIDASGNVGVGVTPSAWSTYQAFQVGNGSISNYSPSQDMRISSNAYFSGGWKYIASASSVQYLQDGSTGQHIWNIASSGSAGGAITYTQAMTLDNSGNLLVGTTSTSQISGTGTKILGGNISVVNTGGADGFDYYNTTAGAFRFYVQATGQISATFTTITAISDQRLKENIRDLDDGLEKIMALKPRKFDWKEGKGADIKNARGFIAQEFETVFPDMIDEWKDPAPEGEEPYKAVNANLIPSLVKAIQEQQALIQSLTTRLTALENK